MEQQPNAMEKAQFICSTCGTVGRPTKVTPGSFLIELALWIFFIIPGVFYSLWRLTSRKEVCPACGQPTMIPIKTPAGQKLIKEQKIEK